MAKFVYDLPAEYLTRMVIDRQPNQSIEVEYTAVKVANHVTVTIKKISFTPFQLNFLSWSPKLFSEIFQMAKRHFEENLVTEKV